MSRLLVARHARVDPDGNLLAPGIDISRGAKGRVPPPGTGTRPSPIAQRISLSSFKKVSGQTILDLPASISALVHGCSLN